MQAKWKLRLAGLAFFVLACSSCTSTIGLTSRRFEFAFWCMGGLAILLAAIGVNLFRAAEGRLGGVASRNFPLLFLLGPAVGAMIGAAKAPALLEIGGLGYLGTGAGMGLVAATAITIQSLVIQRLGVEEEFAASRGIAKREAEQE